MPAVTSESLTASLIGSCRFPWRPFAGPTRLLDAAPRATTGRLYARAEGNPYFFLARRPTIRYPPRYREISRAPAACRAAYARRASCERSFFGCFCGYVYQTYLITSLSYPFVCIFDMIGRPSAGGVLPGRTHALITLLLRTTKIVGDVL